MSYSSAPFSAKLARRAAKLRLSLLCAAGLAVLVPFAARAQCTVDASLGGVDCATTTTVNGGTVNTNGVPPVDTANEYIFNTGVNMGGTIDSGAAVTGSGLWLEQDAADAGLTVYNNGSVTNSTPGNGLEAFGNGGEVQYRGNGSVSETDTSNLWSGLFLVNRNGGGIIVGDSETPITGNFTGLDALYAGNRGGTTDITGNVEVYTNASHFTALSDHNSDAGMFLYTADADDDGTLHGAGSILVRDSGNSVYSGPADTGFGILADSGSGAIDIMSNGLFGTAAANLEEGIRADGNVDIDTDDEEGLGPIEDVLPGQSGVTVTQNGGVTYADLEGIHASNEGDAPVTVNVTNGAIIHETGQHDATNLFAGVRADGQGEVDVNVMDPGTLIDSQQDDGIYADSSGNSVFVTVGAGATVSTTNGAAVHTLSDDGAEIDNAGTLNEASNFGVGAVTTEGNGGITVSNTGTIYGGFNLNGNGDGTIDNSGQWTMSGIVHFNQGDSTFLNRSGATFSIINCSDQCAVNFGNNFDSDGENVFTNAGTLNLGNSSGDEVDFNMEGEDWAAATNTGHINVMGTARFNGAQFDNTGGVVDMRQNVTGDNNHDQVDVEHDFGGGQVGMNVYLGGAGSTADMLKIGGNAVGTTSLIVADTNSGLGGNTGPNGIPLVTVAGTSSASSFALDPASTVMGGRYNVVGGQGVLEKGLFDYRLAEPTSGTFALVSTPTYTAVQAPVAITAVQSIWYETAQVWQNRIDAGASRLDEAPGKVWVSAVGSWSHRADSSSFQIGGTTTAYDLDYDQQVYGLLAGADKTAVFSDGGAFSMGVLGGYVGSDVRFKTSGIAGQAPSRLNYSGGVVGLTAKWRKDGFFVDGMVKGDLLRLHMKSLPDGNGGDTASASIKTDTWGAMADIGRHYDMDNDAWIEPMLTLAGTKSHVGSIDLPAVNTTLGFKDNSTFRVALGARTGKTLRHDDAGTVTATVTGRLWDQTSGDTARVDVINTGDALELHDQLEGAFAELNGRVDWTGASGNSTAFVSADVKFNGQVSTAAVEAGMRWRW